MMVDIKEINKAFITDYLAINELSYRLNEKYKDVGYLNISTMTIVCDLNCSICIESLTKNFKSMYYPLCEIKKAKSNRDSVLTKRGKVKKSFYNQTTITYFNYSKKSIKVFTNGKLQITGIISINDAIDVIQNVIRILVNSDQALLEGKPLPSVENMNLFKVEMINSNFKFGKELKLKKLELKLSKKYNVVYEPDTYPGVKMKYNTSSIFIFGTGNVVITGAKTLKEILMVYDLISMILIESDDLHLKTACVQKQKPVYINTHYGYSARDIICVT